MIGDKGREAADRLIAALRGDDIDFDDVRRVQTEHGDHIEPPCNDGWSHFTQLRWKVAVIKADHGPSNLAVHVSPKGNTYMISGGRVGASDRSFDRAWDYLNGIDHGLAIAERSNLVSDSRTQWAVAFESDRDEPERFIDTYPDEVGARNYAEWFNTHRDHDRAVVVKRTVTIGDWEDA